MIRLTEGEWAILEVLWSGERFPLGEIVSALRPKMNWRRNTVHTYLTRMESKGAGELIAAFLKESHMTQAERDRLRKLLDEMEV